MITFSQAQQAVAEYATRQWWNRSWGDFYVAPDGFEDENTYLVVVGAREFLVEGDDDHVILDAPVFLALKDSGEVITANPLDVPVEQMTPVSSATIPVPHVDPQEKPPMDADAMTAAAASGRFGGDTEKFFGGDKRFPKAKHLGSWEALRSANHDSPEKVSHVGPDEVLFASQDHLDPAVLAAYRNGEKGPHAAAPIKVFQHTRTGRKHVVNGHHRILADRLRGRATPVLYVAGGMLPEDAPPDPTAQAGDVDVFGILKKIKAAWNEAVHPRDKNGRFIPKNANVTLKDGSTGKVTGAKKMKNGGVALTVKRDNGTSAVVQADTVAMQPSTPGYGKMRVIHSNPRVPSGDLMKSIKDNGGFTYDPKTGGLLVPGKDTGIAVAVPGSEQIVGDGKVSRQAFAKGVQKVLMAHRKEIANGAKLGGWYSEDRNVYMVELTDVLPGDDREAALAEGRKRNQEGIFDIGTGEYLSTGGTGDGKTADDIVTGPPGDAPAAPLKWSPDDTVSGPPSAAAPDEWTAHDPATWTPRQREAYDTAGQVIGKYTAIQQQVTQQLQDITNGLNGGASLTGLEFRLKTQKSLARKLHDKTLDPKKGTIPEYAATVGDALRYTQLSDEGRLADNAKATLDALQAKGWTVKEVGNTWVPGAEYKGINTNLTSPDGKLTWELQFHTPQSLAVKEENHKLYDIARLPETPDAEKARLKQQMITNAEAIRQPPRIETVAQPTTPPANVDPLAAPTAAPTEAPLIPPGTTLDPGGLMDIAKANPVGKDFRNMTPSEKIAATAMMHGIGSKQYAQAVKKWGARSGGGGTVG